MRGGKDVQNWLKQQSGDLAPRQPQKQRQNGKGRQKQKNGGFRQLPIGANGPPATAPNCAARVCQIGVVPLHPVLG